MRADGKSQVYMFFSQMLKSFDRGDLKDLYKLVKATYKSTRPVEDLDLLLWGNLKTMFEPHIEDVVWRNQQEYKVLEWKLYDSCGVHSLMMQHMQIYMLVEKKYPLAPLTLSMMLEKKLKIDYESEIGFVAALDVLITGASQSRQHDTLVRLPMDIRLTIDLGKSVGDLTSHLPQSLFDVGSGRISIVTVNTFSITLMF
ncbi:hypothetical protein Tco_1039575 [Tanacetum coccineum]